MTKMCHRSLPRFFCKSRPPLPCPLCSQRVMIRSKSDLMETMRSSNLWGVAGESPTTCSCEQSMALMKAIWHSDAGVIGLNASLFNRSLITSNTVGGLSIKLQARVSKFRQATTWNHSKQLIMLFSNCLPYIWVTCIYFLTRSCVSPGKKETFDVVLCLIYDYTKIRNNFSPVPSSSLSTTCCSLAVNTSLSLCPY